jgi:(p)ppGpp synthase/HD superfamily hydrolase
VATLEKAILLAVKAHSGQKDKAGAPYILHPIRMMLKMSSERAMMAAVLHDVVEDSLISLEDLRNEGFPGEVLNIVESLTRKDGESYDEFIERVRRNPPAIEVKIADLEDNLDIKRMGSLTPLDLDRIKKYHDAWIKLTRAS